MRRKNPAAAKPSGAEASSIARVGYRPEPAMRRPPRRDRAGARLFFPALCKGMGSRARARLPVFRVGGPADTDSGPGGGPVQRPRARPVLPYSAQTNAGAVEGPASVQRDPMCVQGTTTRGRGWILSALDERRPRTACRRGSARDEPLSPALRKQVTVPVLQQSELAFRLQLPDAVRATKTAEGLRER